MIELRTADEIRVAEDATRLGLPGGVLMQRAVAALVGTCVRLIEAVGRDVPGTRVVVLIGSGDNGGDALWAGARLASRGCRVDAVSVADVVHEHGSEALVRAGGRIMRWPTGVEHAVLDGADLIIDGMLGIGAAGALRTEAAELARAVELCDAIVVAVDLPSGVLADSGVILGEAISADVTVTFGAVKPGLVVAPGSAHSGDVILVDIGVDFDTTSRFRIIESLDVSDWVVGPTLDSHKYRRGVVGVSAGSSSYPGAGLLAVAAARRGDVGMVKFLDRSDGVGDRIVGAFPDVVIDGSDPVQQTRVDAWVCGPGFAAGVEEIPAVRAILAADRPVILDAGALSALASDESRKLVYARQERGLITVITPHEGEFERVFPGLLAAGRLSAALAAAAQLGAVVVLKGPGTIIAAPSGDAFIDTEGTADLATAGSGDVLSGLIGAILAAAWARGQRSEAELTEAAAAAVWLHGAAGRIAARQGPITATDIADCIRPAIQAARLGDFASEQ